MIQQPRPVVKVHKAYGAGFRGGEKAYLGFATVRSEHMHCNASGGAELFFTLMAVEGIGAVRSLLGVWVRPALQALDEQLLPRFPEELSGVVTCGPAYRCFHSSAP